MRAWEPLGAHLYCIEEDTVFFTVHGAVSVAEMATHLDRLEAIAARVGWVLTVYDSREGVGISPQARRYVAERMRARPFRAAGGVFGASFVIRTMVTLMVSAVSLFTKSVQRVAYFKTEAEAVAYCVQMRECFRAEVAAERQKASG